MGRKSEKAKEKKMKRKEETAKLQAAQTLVDTANALPDPMAELVAFKKFERNGLNLTISCLRVTDLDEDLQNFVFDITKKNMQNIYESCDWGWNDRTKREEMLEDAAWYLLARDESGKPVAMVHFRFDMDCDDEVLYCYEIQLTQEVRRKGLGKFLMQILELMAYKTNMRKVILTVFKNNPAAQKFFKDKLKYEIDETSPQESTAELMYDDYCYEIVSKMMKRKSPANKPTPLQAQNGQTVAAS